MYAIGLYATIVFGIFLFPFLIPIRSKSATHRRLKRILTIALIVSTLAAIAPDTASIGAPFHKYGKAKIAFFGCNYQIQLTTARFCEQNRTFEWCYCNNFNAFATIAHCYQEGHQDQVDSLLDTCHEYNRTIRRDALVHAENYYKAHAKSIQDIPDFQPNTVVDFPIKLNATETFIFKEAYNNFLGNFDLSVDYGAYLVLYWVIVFTLVSIGNWSKIYFHKMNRNLTDPFSNWFRKLVTLPATGRTRKTNEKRLGYGLDFLVPTRAETLILSTFFGLSVYLLTKNINYTEGDPLFSSKTDETLKILVPRPQDWEAIPGGHAFIHFLRPSCFWQSHPFTYTVTDDEIVLFIKVKKGVTRSMASYLQTHKDKYTKIRVAIEGSYGESTPANKYDTAVFVAGGNGIPGIYAEAVELQSLPKRKIKLIWVVREYSTLFWFYDELLQLRSKDIETTIFVTKPNVSINTEDFRNRFNLLEADALMQTNELTSLLKLPKQSLRVIDATGQSETFDEETSFDQRVKQELSHINFVESRPNIDKLVLTSVEESMGSVCFITCGHPAMVDDLRASVVRHIDNVDRKRIDYFEQLQVWA
ncbi:hypothetical protein KGF57_002054 [Candida theae]|uniref:FAD-binding FR-type domain-containing protein n=1 Tax=Candida theae TaxID=1198502 RepID=A0AAD5BGF5_9ASCO|nr:uncharacterized protein KGF57_002054 [Candida theae]KAI5959529.1 hypothetical protein KGF57_002054 [Candida theae]